MYYKVFSNHPYRFITLVSFVLGIFPLCLNSYPSGQDITLLGDMVQLYLGAWQAHHFYPTSWGPLFGNRDILVFHSSLAPIVAAVEWILPGSILTSLKAVSCLGFILYNVSIFAFLRILTRKNDASIFIAWIMICFAAPVPMRFMGSGGGVFVFSLGLMIFSITSLFNALQTNSMRQSAAGGFLLFNSSLVHPIPAAFSPFFALACLVGGLRGGSSKDIKSTIKVVAIYGICALPAVVFLRPPTPHVHVLVNEWMHHVQDHYSSLPVFNAIADKFDGITWEIARFPGFVIKQFVLVVIPIVVLLGPKIFRSSHRSWFATSLAFAAFVWFAHHTPVIGLGLYLDRGTCLVFLMLGIGVVEAFEIDTQTAKRRWCLSLGLFLLLLVSAGRYVWSYIRQPNMTAVITTTDLEVINQISKTIPSESFIASNYYDAGVWIPALTGFAVTEPHVHFALDESWQEKKKTLPMPSYKFQGSKCLEGEVCPVECGPKDDIVTRIGASVLCKISSP